MHHIMQQTMKHNVQHTLQHQAIHLLAEVVFNFIAELGVFAVGTQRMQIEQLPARAREC